MKRRVIADHDPKNAYSEANNVLRKLKELYTLVEQTNPANFLIPEGLQSDLDLHIRELDTNIKQSSRFRMQ